MTFASFLVFLKLANILHEILHTSLNSCKPLFIFAQSIFARIALIPGILLLPLRVKSRIVGICYLISRLLDPLYKSTMTASGLLENTIGRLISQRVIPNRTQLGMTHFQRLFLFRTIIQFAELDIGEEIFVSSLRLTLPHGHFCLQI